MNATWYYPEIEPIPQFQRCLLFVLLLSLNSLFFNHRHEARYIFYNMLIINMFV